MSVADIDVGAKIIHFLKEVEHPLIVILGPTASGKTGASIELAKQLLSHERQVVRRGSPQVEIVNADSRQLYKYLNIGTAKVTEEEMQGVPHHLIDVLDPKEEVSVGWYQEEATEIINEIHERGNIPFLVGGSMLYVSVITDELTMAPSGSPELRKALEDEFDIDGGETLYKRLLEIDPEAAKTIHKNNKPRLVRAVEIFELTAQPKSKVVPQSEICQVNSTSGHSNFDMLMFGLEIERSVLHERIDQRTKEMFRDGWVDEVRGLLQKGYEPKDPGFKSCGYREIMEAINSGQPIVEEVLEEVIAAKTRQYARRQLTWWRRDKRIQWITSGMQN
ncbi:tRNA (adenosine(37)-N6)-dimethylallyltransferase MiaA [Patescibacteria group bacterium]|nr:tRNA (adenosine(37)-N6)-dimethylallyltransferase MiaA [Patescibacteria group bacterium]